MPGEIFISCGQVTINERTIATNISTLLKSRGFNPYVAIEAQSIEDINNEIIGRLKRSDYYVFIDLRRERISGYLGWTKYRGSLFSNQELAIAYALGFEHVLFLRQQGVILEGIAKYILSNARTFRRFEEVVTLVESEVNTRAWESTYSRNLFTEYIRFFSGVYYKDHTLPQHQVRQICHVGVRNGRTNDVAVNVIAHLIEIIPLGNSAFDHVDTTDLKWATQMGYTRNIPPGETVPFDAFALDERNPCHVYMHSLSDTHPRLPIISQVGRFILRYQIYSENFSVSEFKVELNLTGQIATTTAQLL
jgi:hypothetical protein